MPGTFESRTHAMRAPDLRKRKKPLAGLLILWRRPRDSPTSCGPLPGLHARHFRIPNARYACSGSPQKKKAPCGAFNSLAETEGFSHILRAATGLACPALSNPERTLCVLRISAKEKSPLRGF